MSDNRRARILVGDDDEDTIEAVRLFLKNEGFGVESASAPDEIIRKVQGLDFDVVLLDMNYGSTATAGRQGLELLSRIRDLDATLPVVVMTGWSSISLAVEAMRHGARDFLEKPWENTRLLAIVRNQIEMTRSVRARRRLEAENLVLRGDAIPTLVAESRAMQPVLNMIRRVGPSDANVLVRGEHGTGKGVVARALHAVSRRAEKSLMAVNVSGLSEGVFESELFGHVRGAFTDARADRVGRFELADGGTLFLDEIGSLALPQQAKLLHIIESGEFERVGSSRSIRADVRIVSATNAPLDELVAAGHFRADLLYRLNTVEVMLPPLREREEDIPLLAAHFLRVHARRYGKRFHGFDDAAVTTMAAYPWPGNIRELNHVVERAVLMGGEGLIRNVDLNIAPSQTLPAASIDTMDLDQVERVLIRKALERCDGNVARASELLGISRSALYRRLQRYA